MYTRIFKPVFDYIAGIVLFVISLPFFLMITAVLWVVNDGKPFFIQERPGRGGKIFKIIKFRTMNERRDENGLLLPDFERLTPFGRIVRKLSLDELPQLLNVIKGDMSFIGPRPLLPDYLPLYNDFQKRRHEVKPGITGWAQVNGRNAISWSEKFRLDIWYVENISLSVDLKILWLTFMKVLSSEGVNSSERDTMGRFLGDG
jgi:undecaprenyl phosphate N,N'-diacetylbacillosamine 1-phosphate transferase